MVFNAFEFLLFLPLVVALYRMRGNLTWNMLKGSLYEIPDQICGINPNRTNHCDGSGMEWTVKVTTVLSQTLKCRSWKH